MAGQESAVQKCSVCEVETNADPIKDYNRHYCSDSNEHLLIFHLCYLLKNSAKIPSKQLYIIF